jgi:hypothetical protein
MDELVTWVKELLEEVEPNVTVVEVVTFPATEREVCAPLAPITD